MKIYLYQRQIILLAAFLLFGITSCKKAEEYYDKLHAQPEIRNEYQTVYGVGDTLVLDGRLNPQSNLEIRIGGVKVDPASLSIIQNNIDRAKIVITKEMGVGPNRAIDITSGGNTINCRPIEIIESSSMGKLTGQVKLQRVSNIPNANPIIFCLNGKGTVFFWTAEKNVIRIAKNGSSSQIFTGANFSDSKGVFHITTVTASGVDPTETYLYFAAITSDGHTDNQSNTIYRFCKINLQNGQLTTLNRSALPKTQHERTLEAIQPFEGVMSDVKLYEATGVYPDSKGNVYVRLSRHVMAKLDASGIFKYLINYNNSNVRYLNRIWDDKTATYIGDQLMVSLLPGAKTRQWLFTELAISPDEGILYGRLIGSTVGVTLYDINSQAELYSNDFSYWNPSSSSANPFVSGTFGILTLPAQLGNMALPGKRILNFYNGNGDSRKGFPMLGLLDFNEKIGQRYTPAAVVKGSFNVEPGIDQWLNYDEEGMIYGTANSKTAIIKTVYL